MRLYRTHRDSSATETRADPDFNAKRNVQRSMCDVRMSHNVIGSLCGSDRHYVGPIDCDGGIRRPRCSPPEEYDINPQGGAEGGLSVRDQHFPPEQHSTTNSRSIYLQSQFAYARSDSDAFLDRHNQHDRTPDHTSQATRCFTRTTSIREPRNQNRDSVYRLGSQIPRTRRSGH